MGYIEREEPKRFPQYIFRKHETESIAIIAIGRPYMRFLDRLATELLQSC